MSEETEAQRKRINDLYLRRGEVVRLAREIRESVGLASGAYNRVWKHAELMTREIEQAESELNALAGGMTAVSLTRECSKRMITEVKMVRGINRAAREFGCSKGHLSLVMHGHRKPGSELARKLRRAGIEPNEVRNG